MTIKTIAPQIALHKVFLKETLLQPQLNQFKMQLDALFKELHIAQKGKEGENFQKLIIRDFLQNHTFQQFKINLKDNKDLVIYSGDSTDLPISVLFEVKKPNSSEMMTEDKPNTKALQQLIFYYLDERVRSKTLAIKYLIITDIYNWYLFDENLFDKYFFRNPQWVAAYKNYKANKKRTEDFFSYAAQWLDELPIALECAYFNLEHFKNAADTDLIPLYKILSPTHLLKLPLANDSNQLDKNFYAELLHIIGLEEVKEGAKKIIRRKAKPDEYSLLENAITKLQQRGLRKVENIQKWGSTQDEQFFNIALELSLTWVNRILFLKLLEAQLIAYHRGQRGYAFLHSELIYDYPRLNTLFFEVLAQRPNNRTRDIRIEFENIPYLNSSLFEWTELEDKVLQISQLDNRRTIPIFQHTVLKDDSKKPQTGNKEPLNYLLAFLEAYNFASEGNKTIQADNRNLINASVLGLIFEKINGYKDGSFFTPGFITMYMCRETIRRAVIQKFKEAGFEAETFESLAAEIAVRKQVKPANALLNTLKICDPAVGSGHFLVSALNEMLAIKFELGVLLYRDNGNRISDVLVRVENDELRIMDEDSGEIFQYFINEAGQPPQKRQRLQETLFHEKQTIIENCLFGVDINPNSVKICRLRLWIELLKNAYYTKNSGFTELETLPNIDINIKEGNSLISKLHINDAFNQFDPQRRGNIKKWVPLYKKQVDLYKAVKDKTDKAAIQQKITEYLTSFNALFNPKDKDYLVWKSKKAELKAASTASLFQQDEAYLKRLQLELEPLDKKYIDKERIFDNAFEWRFAFPEVLDADGAFLGFDIIIGNPPYLPLENFEEKEKTEFKRKYTCLERKYESSVLFILEGLQLLRNNGYLSFIAPLTWQTGENYSKFRALIYKKYGIERIVNLPFNIFEDAYVDTAIYLLSVKPNPIFQFYAFDKKEKSVSLENLDFRAISVTSLENNDYKIISDDFVSKLLSILSSEYFIPLGEITKSTQGLSASNFEKVAKTIDSYPFLEKGNVYNYQLNIDTIFETTLKGKLSLKPFYEAEPKILIRRIINRQNRLSVTFTNQKLIFKKDINPFISTNSNYAAKFLTGILASKLISYMYLKISVVATKDDFRQTTLTELRRIPIPKIELAEQQPIIALVEQVLSKKQATPSASTADLEAAIDRLVYQLYDLSAADIALIEAAVK